MSLRLVERDLWPLRLPAILALATAMVACGGPSGGPGPTGSPTATSTTVPLVTGRSAKATDVNAPGIQIPRGTFSVTVGNHNIIIAANNWNTISGSSQVANLIGAEFSPNFNVADDTTRNRFQYLADEIYLHDHSSNFDPLSIVEGIINRELVDIIALYNPTDQVGKLSGLTVTVVVRPSMRTVASATFYGTPSTAVVIPARTIYFTRLTFPNTSSLGPPHNGTRTFTTNFHYSNFKACPGQVCS